MAFGRKTGSLKKLKETLAKGGNGTFIKYVPKNGALNVRFIQEPEEWIAYQEHYDQVLKASYPCNGESTCPGCVSGERKSNRYLANVVDLDNQDRVIALQLPKDLANRLVIRYEKWGSITDRDIELSRSGEGLDTVYDFDAGSIDRKNISKYQPMDLLKVLEDVYDSVFGNSATEDDDEDDAPKSKVKPRAKSPAARKTTSRRNETAEDEDDEDDDEDEDEAPRSRRRPTSRAAAGRKRRDPEPEEDDEDEDADPEDEDEEPAKPARKSRRKAEPEPEPEEDEDDEEDEEEDEEDNEDVEYDEDDLNAMTLGELRAIARDNKINPKGMSKPDLIDAILDGPAPY